MYTLKTEIAQKQPERIPSSSFVPLGSVAQVWQTSLKVKYPSKSSIMPKNILPRIYLK